MLKDANHTGETGEFLQLFGIQLGQEGEGAFAFGVGIGAVAGGMGEFVVNVVPVAAFEVVKDGKALSCNFL